MTNATELALGLALCAVLAAVTRTDLERRLIPNRIVLGGALAALAIAAVGDPSSLAERGIAALAAGGFLLGVALAYPAGMGMGDVKLVAMMGLYLGRAIAPAVLIGLATAAVAGVAIVAGGGPAARKRAIPFAPFLALGGVVALWFGDAMVDWYRGRFLGGD